MPIRVLDAETIGRIAAGEVVERPASIAKELIENSLDAGATSITVEIKDGGCSYLRVTDNGCGIPAEEARIAFENHATSKIVSGDDLSDILTLGFRGEALPSIAAVSRLTMTTRARGTNSGIRLNVEGGSIEDIVAAGCPEGTSIVVRDLFFNTPVRREFLKKPATEGGAVSDMVSRLILGNPGVSIRLISNGKNIYQSFGDGNMRNAALTVYGREAAEKMMNIDESEGSLRIHGLIGVGEMERANRSHQFFFINGRVVRCALLTQALETACRSLVTIGQHPICSLSLHLAPHSVDINVHPSKLEVRFRDENSVRLYVESMLSRAIFNGKMLSPEKAIAQPPKVDSRPGIQILPVKADVIKTEKTVVGPSIHDAKKAQFEQMEVVPNKQKNEGKFSIVIPDFSARQEVLRDPSPNVAHKIEIDHPVPLDLSEFSKKKTGVSSSVHAKLPEQTEVSNSLTETTTDALKILGVFARTYILIEYKESLIMIDQHAAHERLRYQEYESALHHGNASQPLLTPIILSLSQRERGILLSNQELLSQSGYEIEPFGERDIQVRAVPHVLGKAELRPLFLEMIDQLDQLKTATLDRRRAEIIQASCKRAVKAGDSLSDAEIRSLIAEMLKTDAPPTCPHGRPVLKVLRKSEIEKMFKRT